MGPRLFAPSGEQVLLQWQAQQCAWTGLTADNWLQAPPLPPLGMLVHLESVH